MDGQLLDAEQVLAVWHAFGDRDAVALCEVPGCAAAVEGRADVFDLEPDAAGAVEGVGGAGGLGHVEGDGALVVDGDVGGEGEG